MTLIDLADGTYRVRGDHLEAEDLHDGYAVALYPIEPDDPRPLYDGVEFGVWTAPDGSRHYDRVVVVDQRDLAIRLGRTNSQSAIYDLARQEVVLV